MRSGADNGKFLNLVLVAFIIAAFVFASPFHQWWMVPETPWYVPYLIWLAIIVMTGIVHRRRGRHDL